MIDATAVRDFRRCPEYYRNRHVLGLVRDVYEEATASGKAAHAALVPWFNDEGLDASLAALRAAWGREESALDPPAKRPLSLFENIIKTYAEKYPRESDNFKVLKNETYTEAEMPFGGYCGVIDREIEYENGNVFLIDSKFTALYLSDQYFESFRLSPQLIGYVAMKMVKGERCDGAYVDAVHVDTRYHKVKLEHFRRWGPITFPQAAIDLWARSVAVNLDAIERRLRIFGKDSRWPQHGDSCIMFNKLCPYWDRCTVSEKAADGFNIMSLYRVEKWDPKDRK